MADETSDEAGAAAADAGASPSSPAKKPAAPRRRAAAKTAEGADAPVKAPRARATAKKADAADAPAKAPRTRAAARKPAADEATAPVAHAGEAPAEAAKASKPARRGSTAKESAKPVPAVVRAQARYVRSSARKARLVCDHIRGKSVPDARAVLDFAPRGVAKDWSKLLNSAVANAENNHELVGDELHVTAVYADEGPTLKRFRPRAMGRATPIHKRTSHLTIELGAKE
jgi:ribosomal protein L22